MGLALRHAGYTIDAVVSRSLPRSKRRAARMARELSSKAITLKEFQPQADIIWVCHTDDALAETARALAQRGRWKGKIVLHSSGALSSDVLAPLRLAGAFTASLHPMMTFVAGTSPDMQKVPFAVEGDRQAVAAAKEIVRRFKAKVFPIRKESKVLYHALGSFSSPMIVATLVTAERVGRAAGLAPEHVKKVMTRILLQTITNYVERGPDAAFSGPIKRGDLNTVRRHLKELQRVPGAREVYRALVRSALMELRVERRGEMGRLLENLTADHTD